MRTPFWWGRQNPLAWALTPLSLLWCIGAKIRPYTGNPTKVSLPVLCVGNAVAGGAGKTPVVLSLAAMLHEMQQMPQILSRGYGGEKVSRVPQRVTRQSAADVGDEPLLLAKAAPTWVGQDRVASAQAAIGEQAGILLLDDGWQSPHLHKDINLMVVDGAYGVGNGFCIPAGPLREPWKQAVSRADAVVMLGNDRQGLTKKLSIPVFHARIQPQAEVAAAWQGKRVYAFAGIGRPAKFFHTLMTLGADLQGAAHFADHHPFLEEELGSMADDAERLNATLITTEKDWVRLSPAWQAQVHYLPVQCVWEDEAAVKTWLAQRLER